MADNDGELLDYEEEEVVGTGAPAAAAPAPARETKKGSYVGIHATGFRDLMLKPELMKAITDSGFEHPSEGTARQPRTERAETQASRMVTWSDGRRLRFG
jgi:hypothetical protein